MKDVLLALSGVVVAGIFGLILDRRRRTDERNRHLLERSEAIEDRTIHRRELLDDETRARRQIAYLSTLSRLLSMHAALHRASRVLYLDNFFGGDHPFSTRESIESAIDEAEGLRSVQADLELFGSEQLAEQFASIANLAATLRFALGLNEQWDDTWAKEKLAELDTHFNVARRLMRSELARP